ncbi:MAG: EbsA family protein [Lactobacillales bacterium]|jgi:hypothetical protein|nr:EbsA family protein [Lactobacillales bacterium]
MIKIFGKIRYHWQPELATSIIYWSLTFSLLFFSLIFTLEKTHVYTTTFAVFFAFLVLSIIGLHRYFVITEDNMLQIIALTPRHREKIPLQSIEKIRIGEKGIEIFSTKWKSGRIFYMRKWHKEPFIEELMKHGEVQAKFEKIKHLKLDDLNDK